ncbi:MAG: glycosyltransferase family 4 protein [Sulfuricaulis sp.]
MRNSSLRVLSFTTLFPNQQQPAHGLFVKERILALARLVDLRVVAPVPWFPRTRIFGERYYRYAMVPLKENCTGTPVEHPRFPVIPRLCKTIDGPLLAAGSRSCLRKIREAFPFDIIDAHWAYPDGVAAAILAGRFRVPLAITVRGDDINIFLKEFWRKPWIRWSLGKADLIIALSRELKDIVVTTGVAPSKVVVIPNGINPEIFHPVDRKLARARLGLPADARIVLSVGRLHRSKGYPVLVEAAARLSGKFPDLHVHIVGSPDHEADARPAIIAAATRGHIAQRVHLIGAQDPGTMKYWYSAADVFCLATSREGSANVLIEAMACGLPCVTTPVGGNPEAVNSTDVGILCAPDVDSMSQALATGLTRQWDRERIAAHGQSRTWQTVAAECRDHLSTVLDPSFRLIARDL